MSEIRHPTGLVVKDEKWSWSDLAHELADNFRVEDLSDFVFLLKTYKKGLKKEIG